MQVIVAEHAGTCFGVKRALDIAFEVADSGCKAQTLGPLIHNPRVVRKFEDAGITVANEVSEVKADTVILRSHGVLPEIRAQLAEKGVDVKDATCPYVLRAQKGAESLAKNHEALIVVGDSGHPEVEGLIAYGKLGNDKVYVVSSAADIPSDLPNDLGLVVQTTQREEVLDEVIAHLHETGKRVEIKNTICGATHIRQSSALDMARSVDAVVVVGGKNSSNTTRLYHICAEQCARCFHIERTDEIDPAWFEACETVGVAAGASTPEDQIEEVVQALEALPAVSCGQAEANGHSDDPMDRD